MFFIYYSVSVCQAVSYHAGLIQNVVGGLVCNVAVVSTYYSLTIRLILLTVCRCTEIFHSMHDKSLISTAQILDMWHLVRNIYTRCRDC